MSMQTMQPMQPMQTTQKTATLSGLFFDNPSDSNTGFLSNRSHHSIVIDGKKWLTVEHYIQASKFEGTAYEEVIRNAPTAQKARLLARERNLLRDAANGDLIKETVYGRTKSIRIRDDWTSVEPKYVETGIRAKFKQHPKLIRKLVQTGTLPLTNTKCKYSGKVLEKIRKESVVASLTNNNKEAVQKASTVIKDLPFSQLSTEHVLLARSLTILIMRIQREEGAKTIHADMLEDAIHTLVRDEAVTASILSEIAPAPTSSAGDTSNSAGWQHIYSSSKLPNLKNVVVQLHDIFQSSSIKFDIEKVVVAAIFLKVLHYNRELRAEVQKNSIAADTINLVFLRKQRSYRKVKLPSSNSRPSLSTKQINDADILEVVKNIKVCEAAQGFSSDQIAVVAALLHLTKGGKGSMVWAFLLLVAPSKRDEVQRSLSKLKVLSGTFEGLSKLCNYLGVQLSEDDMSIVDHAMYYFTRRVGAVSAHTKLFAFAYLSKKGLLGGDQSTRGAAATVSTATSTATSTAVVEDMPTSVDNTTLSDEEAKIVD